jgi:hypothetical protein
VRLNSEYAAYFAAPIDPLFNRRQSGDKAMTSKCQQVATPNGKLGLYNRRKVANELRVNVVAFRQLASRKQGTGQNECSLPAHEWDGLQNR